MTEIKWEEPESAKSGPGRKGRYEEVTKLLKASPGKWALVAENVSHSVAGYLKVRYGLEVTAREVKDGRAAKIYARWPEPGV